MSAIHLTYLLCGLALGAALQGAGATERTRVREAAALRDWAGARTALYTLGLGMAVTALLCWLAVMDVDLLRVAPLTAGIIAGAVCFGAALGLCGASPLTLVAGIGGGAFWESLCGAAGCVAGAWLGSLIPAEALDGLFPPVRGTVFRLTLSDPYLLGGSFAALACTGAVVCALALFFRRPTDPAQPDAPDADAALFDGDTPEAPAADDASQPSD